MDWDDAYSNAKYIEGAEIFPIEWKSNAQIYRDKLLAEGRAKLDQSYGPHLRHRYDLFKPLQTPKGIFVFIHGGYWLDFDKNTWSHFVETAVEAGYLAFVPSYRLAPDVSIPEIISDIQSFIEVISEKFCGPITIAGHSAGGHLATSMGFCKNGLKRYLIQRIQHIISISGIFDLTPLQCTSMNKLLQVTDNIKYTCNPIDCEPSNHIHFSCFVGQHERPEFLRQNALLKHYWPDKNITEIIVPHKHHFDVIEILRDDRYGFFK